MKNLRDKLYDTVSDHGDEHVAGRRWRIIDGVLTHKYSWGDSFAIIVKETPEQADRKTIRQVKRGITRLINDDVLKPLQDKIDEQS